MSHTAHKGFAMNAASQQSSANLFLKSCRCPICSAKVMVRKHGKIKTSLLRSLALADHVRTLHPSVAR